MDLAYASANDLAMAIRNQTVSATEVAEFHLARIARHNPALNAIVTLDQLRVRREAQAADAAIAAGVPLGPLHGVPVTIKDVFETAGMRTTAGSKRLEHYIPAADATAVARLRAAGAIILGKTNTSELAGDIQTNSPLLGRANNPWDVNRTSGGSSGGDGAAVAAGLAPLGLGSDLAGSIRIPAHSCGILGLRPTHRRVSGAGHIPPLPGLPSTGHEINTCGPLARSVADLRLCLEVIAGTDPRDPHIPPVPLTDAPRRSLGELRLAWSDAFAGAALSNDTRGTLHTLADTLAVAGCHVERANPPAFDFELAWQTYGELLGFNSAPSLSRLQRVAFRGLGRRLFRDPIMSAAAGVALLPMQRYLQALQVRDHLIATLESFLEGCDGWLCPVAAVPAYPHRRGGPIGTPIEVDGEQVPYWAATIAYTSIFSLTGHPVVTSPIGQSAEGLPIGVQLVGRRWSEPALLRTAEAIMEHLGPVRRPPGF